MGAIVLKYVQLICVAFFMKNSNCAHLLEAEELSNLKISTCVAECAARNQSNYTGNDNLEVCFEECKETSYDDRDLNFVSPDKNDDFHLYCRNAQSLFINIDHNVTAVNDDEHFIYMLIAKETTGKFADRLYIFSNEKLINVTVADLSIQETTSLSYDITVYIISSLNNMVRKLKQKTYTTLMVDYKPVDVDTIEFKEWVEYYDYDMDKMRLNLTFTWKPERSNTCDFEALIYGDDREITLFDVPFKGLYEYTMTNLSYDSDYSVAIRAINSYNHTIKSHENWTFIEKCLSEVPLNVMVFVHHVDSRIFDINVTWNEPNIHPKYYEIDIKNIYSFNGSGIYTATANGSSTWHYFENIELTGSSYIVNIKGFAEDGTIQVHDYNFEQTPIVEHSKVFNILFYIFVALVVVLLLFLFKIWSGKIDSFISKMAQKRVDDMDIAIVKTMSTGTVLEEIAELTKDNSMEVERENITIMQLLGEGAFGLVKKGLIIKNGEKQHVAVKMIKNTSNLEDIKQFHQEICVMKSVGHHENIVSIVGHCTSEINELMLLTEYCDDGNLLELLRKEFAKQLKFYDAMEKMNSSLEKYHDSLLNFDMTESDKKEISYKNLGCSTTTTLATINEKKLFAVNKMYDELNNNNVLKAIEMTATNALYLKLNETDTNAAQVKEIIKNDEVLDDFLTSADLLSFATQICDGMDFLARKKVVHRDLAARNILVCSDKTIKISDFGLSRDIYQDLVYRKTGNGKLPIKWLALESMTHQVYTSQSDVWSFGVLLYEIVTLGAVPYSSINVENLLKFLRSGFRLEKPYHCHMMLYELMMLCWLTNPLDRPSFKDLSEKIRNFATIQESFGDHEKMIDLPKMFNNCMNEVNYMKPLI